jgi:hypothetical protein
LTWIDDWLLVDEEVELDVEVNVEDVEDVEVDEVGVEVDVEVEVDDEVEVDFEVDDVDVGVDVEVDVEVDVVEVLVWELPGANTVNADTIRMTTMTTATIAITVARWEVIMHSVYL